ncbi:MAG: SRPBCC domain-containing protein [Chloroflexi bacterium]|nr:SRPBCC domain-containing protein [Chloroflexota bacterium]
MPDVFLQETVPLPPQAAFDIFVEQMDVWWPRQGVFPYSFAPKPKGVFPRHIRFEAELNGRYYESFSDGGEYEIGRITVWQPPATLGYTWQDPTWRGHNQITLRFATEGAATLVTYEQDGFAGAGVADLIPYYQIGCRQTLSAYIAHCRAIFELQQLGQ